MPSIAPRLFNRNGFLRRKCQESGDKGLTEAVLGGRIAVPTPDGPVTVTIPKVQSRENSAAEGPGRPRGGDQRGDEYLARQITLPEKRDLDLEIFVSHWPAGMAYNPRSAMGVA
jgi:DnaJ-class molecular chaperone